MFENEKGDADEYPRRLKRVGSAVVTQLERELAHLADHDVRKPLGLGVPCFAPHIACSVDRDNPHAPGDALYQWC